jgi:hypothetical protein
MDHLVPRRLTLAPLGHHLTMFRVLKTGGSDPPGFWVRPAVILA